MDRTTMIALGAGAVAIGAILYFDRPAPVDPSFAPAPIATGALTFAGSTDSSALQQALAAALGGGATPTFANTALPVVAPVSIPAVSTAPNPTYTIQTTSPVGTIATVTGRTPSPTRINPTTGLRIQAPHFG